MHIAGKDYVAIFEPMFTRPGRMAVDGFTALALELTALWFQHVMLLNLACSVFMNAARYSAFWVLRDWRDRPENSAALCSDGYLVVSAFRGVQLTYEHTMLQLYPCRLRPVILWLVSRNGCRWINGAASVCRLWRLRRASVGIFSLEMPQWLLGIFIAYLIVAVRW